MLGVALNRMKLKPSPGSAEGWKVPSWSSWTPADPEKKDAFYIDVVAIHEDHLPVVVRVTFPKPEIDLNPEQEFYDQLVYNRVWQVLGPAIEAQQ